MIDRLSPLPYVSRLILQTVCQQPYPAITVFRDRYCSAFRVFQFPNISREGVLHDEAQCIRVELGRAKPISIPIKKEYVDATSVARLNGYAGGYGAKVQLMREIDGLGLSPEGKRYLLNIVE